MNTQQTDIQTNKGGNKALKVPPQPTPNLVYIIVNLYSLPFVIREYVHKQLTFLTLKVEVNTRKPSMAQGKLIKTQTKEGNKDVIGVGKSNKRRQIRLH